MGEKQRSDKGNVFFYGIPKENDWPRKRRAVIVNEVIIYLISISVILVMGIIAIVNLIMFIGKEKKK